MSSPEKPRSLERGVVTHLHILAPDYPTALRAYQRSGLPAALYTRAEHLQGLSLSRLHVCGPRTRFTPDVLAEVARLEERGTEIIYGT